MNNPFRLLPSVHEVLETAAVRESGSDQAHADLVAAIRSELTDLRAQCVNGDIANGQWTAEQIGLRVVARVNEDLRPQLQSVINATGIILHTNLGRAPLAEPAAQAAYEAARGYLNLELDLASGKRSTRQEAMRKWVCRLTGAESATAVNNNAAATVIALRALCQGQEVIISRGQLIEIGGSFRIPEIMAVSGAELREVGTTNITRLADYEQAIGPNTGALMQVHTSNYRVAGFTKGVALADLVKLGDKHGIPVIDDIGSGAMIDFERFGFSGEPIAKASIQAGADLVLFSGDKLLGGPQAGILAGQKRWIRKIEKDPLMRAFRLDKMTLAALETTLRLYSQEAKAIKEIPTLRMLAMPSDELQKRAKAFALILQEIPGMEKVLVHEDKGYVGGGSLPEQALTTWVIDIRARNMTEDDLARRLRVGSPSVMCRARAGYVVIDLRTVFPRQEEKLVAALNQACQ